MGFIGRNVLAHIVENGLASYVRVVDKQVPSTVYLNTRCQTALNSPGVTIYDMDIYSQRERKRERERERERERKKEKKSRKRERENILLIYLVFFPQSPGAFYAGESCS